MATEQERLQAGIAALESQRALLGDAVVEAALAPLRARLAALAAVQPAPATQTLKQVTVLFLDVVGSTSLSQQLDPEDIHAVMDGALARCTRIVESHRGKVLQYAGDSLLAVFGADESREDDPELAVRCGLALLAEGRALGEDIRRRHGHQGFDVRVGLHTGSVLLGGGVDAEGSIRGIAVSIAARMEQTAPAGSVRISRDTHRHVRGLFEVQAQPPMAVKGLDEPVVTYLVVRAKPRAFRIAARGIEGVETRMVGRDAEFAQLREAFKALHREGRLIAVTVVGEAGVGKSRLLDEFEKWAESQPERCTVLQGRATPQTESHPYGLLRDILARRLQIADGDSMEIARQKIERGVAPLFAADDGEEMAQAHSHVLGHLIGLDFGDSRHIRGIREDGKQMRDHGFHAAAQMFRRVAAQGGAPVLLLLEDLHWADAASLDFLAHLARANGDVPMLMLGLTRPTLFERRSSWHGHADMRRIELSPLDESASLLLANELLKKLPEVPAALRTLITSAAEGNPFYMEELVNMLVDKGAIETGPERWALHPGRLLAAQVPQTLTGVLQARLDGLPAAERLTLQEASVIGFVFWDQALAAIDAQAGLSLPALVQRALTLPRQDASLEGLREYVFRHQLLHHVTYETLLKRTRRELHAKVAAWLAGLANVRANDLLAVTASHYEQAADHANACEFFARAAENAAGRFAHEAAMDCVSRALALIGADSRLGNAQLRWRLLDVRERTLDHRGSREQQTADLDALQELADALDDDHRRGVVSWRRSDLAFRTSDYRAMDSAARQTVALAARAGDDVLRLTAQDRLAIALTHLGRAEEALALARDGLAEARAKGLRRCEGRWLNALAMLAEHRGDVMAMLEADQQQVAIVRELGDRRSESIALANLGLSWLNLGDREKARHFLDQGLRLMRAIGDRTQEPYALVNLSQLALWEGDAALALVHAQAALDITRVVQDRLQEATALCWVANAELAQGRHAAAVTAFERAHSLASTLEHAQRHDAAAGLARVALAQGDVARASIPVESLLAHLAAGGTLEGAEAPRLIQLTCYQVLVRAGDPRADALLASAHADLQRRAAAISDATWRHSFLNHIPEHREITAAWAARGADQRIGSAPRNCPAAR